MVALCSEVAIRRLSFARHAWRYHRRSALQQAGLVYGHVQHPVCQRGAQGIAQAGLAHAGHRVAVAVGQQGIAALQHQVRVQQLQRRRARSSRSDCRAMWRAQFFEPNRPPALYSSALGALNSIAFRAAGAARSGPGATARAQPGPMGAPAAAPAWSRRWWRRSIWRCTALSSRSRQQIKGAQPHLARLGHQFGGSRGRGRAQVGARSAMVTSVSCPTPHTSGTGLCHGAHQLLVVEGPQVLQRPATAHQQQGVDLGTPAGQLQRSLQCGRALRRPAPGLGRR
jgi:hypothetical protein